MNSGIGNWALWFLWSTEQWREKPAEKSVQREGAGAALGIWCGSWDWALEQSSLHIPCNWTSVNFVPAGKCSAAVPASGEVWRGHSAGSFGIETHSLSIFWELCLNFCWLTLSWLRLISTAWCSYLECFWIFYLNWFAGELSANSLSHRLAGISLHPIDSLLYFAEQLH